MRFLTRTLAGVFLLCLTLGLLAMAAGTVFRALQQADDSDPRGGAREREFAVYVDTLSLGTATPVITAYGEVASGRTLEIRSGAAGRVSKLSEAYRDGGRVAAGSLLVQIDPVDARAALDIARADLDEAEAQRVEAEQTLELARQDLAAAQQSRDLRARALERQSAIRDRGAGTGAAVEESEIALASADQALVGRRQALAQAEAQADQARIAVTRRGIALREAERALDDTTITAPFAGLLTATTAVPGGQVSANEKLGSLIDTAALEIAFRVSNAEYARLVGRAGELGEIRIRATLPLDGFPIEVTGRVDRVGAEVGSGQTGRVLYARLDGPGAAALRPGDFVTVEIPEPPLQGVAVIPAAAVAADGEVLLLADDGRLEAARLRILRRQGDDVIVADAPAGRTYVRERQPQLGPGVKVRPVEGGADGAAADAAAQAAPPTLVLSADRRARLIAFVEGNARMPDEVKARLLAQLSAEQVPAEVVERLESRMGG
ncbi:HlyD family efflux transporter periplasmic adaptor subunit [Rhodobacteraceae bacterium 2CG4]|uniref:HlyD family efflux transporter periplasmic adaptor subunit n=1 Tax=Halovulum marinum TaxID=2662447 RepID=A0A6L5Z3Y5_9RHOB|nr:HlyD family efflux transporter periplasmic adaptor subunit [Halovulum marinum]MSU91301.1 HlyD family efflux transporter periplasmic adaptor subunit [Halovulum marinum]